MPKHVFLFLLLFSSAFTAVAQRYDRDDAPAPVPGDTAKVNSLIEQSYLVRASNPVIAKEYCLSAIRISRQLKYKKGEGRALGSLGWTYYTSADYVDAVETCNEALFIAERVNDKYEMARSHNNVGALNFQRKQWTSAIGHFKKGLALSTEVKDLRTVARSLNNLATMFELMPNPNFDSSRIYAERGLAVGKISGDHYTLAASHHILGRLNVLEKKYTAAIADFNQTLAVSDQLTTTMKLDTRNEIAEAYLLQNKTPEALAILKQTRDMSLKTNSREQLATSYKLLAGLYKNLEEYKMAFECQELFSRLQDSIHRDDITNKLATTQTQSDLDIKQTQIELLTKDTLLNKDEINRQRTQLYTMIGGFIGILFLAGVLVFSYQRIERTNVLLKQRTAQLARINSTKDKLFSIISHDFRSPMNSLKGLLSLVENKNLTREEFSMLAEKLRKNFNAVSNDLENLLQWSMAQLQGIQTHSVKINVQPIVDEHIVVFQEIAKAKNVQIKNNIETDLYGIADEDHIRLVLRNLINNAIKFTPPGGTVEISGYQESPFITIQVADTGVGIATEQMETLFHKDRSVSTRGTNQEKGVGLGLLLCAEFVETNGGQLNVASQIGKGSVFSFTLRAA